MYHVLYLNRILFKSNIGWVISVGQYILLNELKFSEAEEGRLLSERLNTVYAIQLRGYIFQRLLLARKISCISKNCIFV